MKKLLAASLIAVGAVTAARAEPLKVYDAYIGMDLGFGLMSYIDTSAKEIENYGMPESALMMGFDIGGKFRPLDSIWNPGLSLSWNLSFPIEPEKSNVTYNWYTFGADFDNYFAIANRTNADVRTDLILGIGYHAITTSYMGGGLGSGSDTDMSLAFKFGIDQGITENIKLNAKMQFFMLPGSHKYEQDIFTKVSIGFKMVF